MAPWARSRLPYAVAALLLVLLAALATLQWRWIGEVSAMARQRLQASLLAAGSSFAEDFDREVTRAYLYFYPDHLRAAGSPAERLDRIVRQYERWLAEAPYPELIGDLLVVRPGEGGPSLAVLRPEERRFAAIPWPADLAGQRRRLEAAPPSSRALARSLGAVRGVVPELPGLVIPLSSRSRDPGDPLAGAYLLVRLDERAIAREILPALTRRYFGSPEGVEYEVAVLDPRRGRVLFRSDPSLPAAELRAADARLPLLGLRAFDELRSLSAGRGPRLRRHSGGTRSGLRPPIMDRYREGAWVLAIKRRDGSLDEAVAAVRRRNLGVSLGILGLLAATVAALVVTTQRAQRLARQQLEFVAGVTHELHTPLTAIRSAGANLADGVVADPDQVRRYGALIDGEGRRLSDMVGQVLELAGIQSGRRAYRLEPAAVPEIVDGALADSRWLLAEGGIEVEREVAPDLPPVEADPAALRRAVQNLIENGVKYGGRKRWLAVRARRAAAGGVEITVADRGPGVARADLPHLFEPFYRGRDAAAGGVPGSGLGLSLVRHIVEAHGGRVTVATGGPEGGSAFTLHLPAASGSVARPERSQTVPAGTKPA